MKTIKVTDATNNQLDWLVAKGEGWVPDGAKDAWIFWPPRKWFLEDGEEDEDEEDVSYRGYVDFETMDSLNYTCNWDLMGPLIDREDIAIGHGNSQEHPDNRHEAAIIRVKPWAITGQGPTKLIAAARCYVAKTFGETVEVPEGLK